MPRTREQRAQIFQSFDALQGFRETLREQERIVVPKKYLSEDDYEELNRTVHQIQPGMMVRVVFYDQGQYVELQGKVAKINLTTKMIQIVKSKFNITDFVDIEILE